MSRPPSPSSSIEDPEARWERIRSSWLTPSPPSTSSSPPTSSDLPRSSPPLSTPPNTNGFKKPKDSLFMQRIRTLEQMLRAANEGGINPSGASASCPAAVTVDVPQLLETSNGKGKGKAEAKEDQIEEEEFDGGFTIGGEKKGNTQELKKVSEGIFLAFKQGRPLKESLPLSLVTSLLYRGWLLDGTIPASYSRSLAEPDPPMPQPLPTRPPIISSLLTDEPPSSGSAAPLPSPNPLSVLSEINSNAVTPLPSSTEDSVATPTPFNTQTPNESPSQSLKQVPQSDGKQGEMLPPPVPGHGQGIKPGLNPIQPLSSKEEEEKSGGLKLDVLRGSRWRTERDVASGSDVI